MAESIRTIKKYPNRRLYDTANSGYITLADVKQMVLENIEFQVDAKSGEDLTRAILLQIILDEESGGLDVQLRDARSDDPLLRQRAADDHGQYIEQNVKAFLAIQKKLQDQAKQIYGDKMMLTPDLWKQFMQMQAPAMQGMLGNYLEQSARLFMDMQQRMQDQTRGMFAAFPSRTSATHRSRATTTRSAERAAQPASAVDAPGDAIGAVKSLMPCARTTRSHAPPMKESSKPAGAPAPSVGFVSLGCPKALVDSEQILTQLKAEGYAVSPTTRAPTSSS